MNYTKQILIVDIDDLIPYARNARTHSREQIGKIRASIREFGFVNPILIDKDKNIIAGHGRVTAAREEKIREIPCLIVDYLTETQKRAYILVDNKLAEEAGWDSEMLEIEIQALTDVGFNVELTGFSLDEFEIESLNVSKDEKEFEIELPKEPTSKIGDIFLLGKHRLMCGDATKNSDVDKLCDGKLCDLFLVDPPYNINYIGKTEQSLKINNDNLNQTEYKQFLCDIFACADNHMNDGGVFYIWYAGSEVLIVLNACEQTEWKVRQNLIWNKNSFVMGHSDYHYKHEPCLYGWKNGKAHYWGSDRKQATVLDFDRPSKNIEHPTMKPLDLFSYLILNSSKQNQNVLDLCAGSGTSLIACEQNDRVCFAMEIDPRYCDVILDRFFRYTGIEPIKVEG